MKAFLSRLYHWLTAPWRLIQRLVYIIGWVVVVGSAAVLAAIVIFFHSLPDVSAMNFDQLQQQATQRVHLRMEASKVHYQWVPLRQVNRDLLYTIVMAEDATFFRHQGINYDAMVEP